MDEPICTVSLTAAGMVTIMFSGERHPTADDLDAMVEVILFWRKALIAAEEPTR